METKLKVKEVIPSYATDFRKQLKPTAFMDYAQEMAYKGATNLGFGYDVLVKTNMAWVLSRVHLQFVRPVLWREEVELQTWHKGLNGLYFIRDFMMLGGDGEPSVRGTSSWIVLDTEARSFVRTEKIQEIVPDDSQCSDAAIEEPCPKVMMPRKSEPEKVGERVVNYSDVDFLGHTNNVRYAVWSMDAAGTDITFERPCKELFINFNKETHVGETVEIFRLIQTDEQTGEITVTVEGKVEGQQSFCCKLIF